MKPGTTLFRSDYTIFEVLESDLLDQENDYLNWELFPLSGQTLAKEHTRTGLADGHFVLQGLLVHSDGNIGQAYVDIVLPEREIDSHFLFVEGKIIKGRGALIPNGQIVPAIAVEKFGAYNQYYVRGRAEIGLQTLRDGLAAAKTKWPIALDMAYILRDEKRYLEAIEAFTLAIDQHASIPYLIYEERAQLLDKVGNREAAARDWEHARRLSNDGVVGHMRRR